MPFSLSVRQSRFLDQQLNWLRPRLQQLPPLGSRPLVIAGRVAGWLSPQALPYLLNVKGVYLEEEAVYVQPQAALSVNAVLAQVAHVLNNAGLLLGWRNELLDVIAENEVVARVERAATRPLGLLTRSVHLNAAAPAGHIWLARRALNKTINPGMWDTLVKGLVIAGESERDALYRESQEEAGLSASLLNKASALQSIARIHKRIPEGYQVEEVLVSQCILDEAFIPQNQDGEIIEIRCMSPDEVKGLMKAGAVTDEAQLVILHSWKTACFYRLK